MAIPEDKIIKIYHEEYKKGISGLKLSEKYNVPSLYFYRWFKKLGLEARDNSINSLKYTYNKDYFEAIDTQDKAYWLGFIYADGYIVNKRKYSNRKLGITLKVDDLSHLEKFKKCIEGIMPIKVYTSSSGFSRNKYCRILITGEKITDDLIKHGVLENKTNILDKPDIEKHLIPHFVRGYFDGDGSIWKQGNKKNRVPQYSVSFIGIDTILNFIMKELINNNVIYREYKLNKRKKAQTVSNFKFGGNIQTLRFLDYIYKDANIYLDRKYSIYLDLQKLISSRS